MAMAGLMWPAVPPPVSNIRMVIPHLTFNMGGTGYREQDAHFCKQHNERGAAVAEEGERDAGIGDGVGHHRHVQQDLHGDLGTDAKGGQPAKRVRVAQGYRIAAVDEQAEQQNDGTSAQKTKLLTHNGKNKIILRLGYVAEFQAAVAKPQAEKTAGADGHHSLQGLPPAVKRIGGRVLPYQDASLCIIGK